MHNFKLKVNTETFEIVEGKEYLQTCGVYEFISSALSDEEDVTKYLFANEDEKNYQLIFEKADLEYTYYKLLLVTSDNKQHKKGKYSKAEMKRHGIEKLIEDVGFVNAQMLHAKDFNEYDYMPLRQYLKQNKNEFKKMYIYEKDFNNQYQILRHKNLFSKYKDEISDFEKLTTVERYEPKYLKVSYEIDEDVFDYDGSHVSLTDRKFLREFAKDIYTKKNRYTERELFEILSGRDLYVQIVTTTPKEHKDVWSKVGIEEMDIRVLEKYRSDFYKEKVPKDKKRKYMTKKQKVRKNRVALKRENRKRLTEFYDYEI